MNFGRTVATRTVRAAARVVFRPRVAVRVGTAALTVGRVLAHGNEGAAAVVLWVGGVWGALVAGHAAGGAVVRGVAAALAVSRRAVGRVRRFVDAPGRRYTTRAKVRSKQHQQQMHRS
jgi:hypothetical protein